MSRNKLELRHNPKSLVDSSNAPVTGNYELEQTIGQGHFAIVKSARHTFSGERVAIKIIEKQKLDAVSREHLFQEVKCMKLVQHPNVVRLYQVIDTHTKLYLIQELGDGGDMYDYIMKHSHGLDEDQAKLYFSQIVDAVKYCHGLRVVHRDLKPENVVFFQQSGQVKLTDFGFSNIYEPDSKLLTSCGSLAYSAPEILLGDSYYAPPVDIWSLGVILYMLVTGRAPFQEANDSETLMMILDCKYHLPDHLSAQCSDLICRMLVRDPGERATLDQIRCHQWLANESDESDIESSPSRPPLTNEDREKVIQMMIDGQICQSRQTIEQNLQMDAYNHVTASFYLLAEKIARCHGDKKRKHKMSRCHGDKKRKHVANAACLSKRKPLVDVQTPNVVVVSSGSVLSKSQFKLKQRNLLLRQTEAKEEEENLVEEEDEQQMDDAVDLNTSPPLQLSNILEDQDQLNLDETNPSIRVPIQLSHSVTRRSSRGPSMSQSDNLISKLTIPEEEGEVDREMAAGNLEELARFKQTKMSTDTSDSDTEANRVHEWARSTSSTSRSRARLRSSNNFNRPLSVSQLSKNNSFRHHRSTIGGTETPAQIYSQPISSTTPTPRESVVFNRGDDKPFVKLLQQMNYKSKSMDQRIGQVEPRPESRSEPYSQTRPNND
ncbi:SNF-related serine threonine- kinase, partial [Brachionus plicatilis]